MSPNGKTTVSSPTTSSRAGHFSLTVCVVLMALALSSCKLLEDRAMIPNGRIVATTKDGKKRYEKEWLEKKRHGTWRDYNAEGILVAEYSYDRGQKTGTWKKFYPNGRLENQVAYAHDKEDGPALSWHENGKKSFEGTFKEGRKNGVFRTWSSEGQITSEIEWENDVSMEGKFTPVGKQ